MEDSNDVFTIAVTCDQCGNEIGDEPTTTCGDCEWVLHQRCLPEHRKEIHA